MCADKKPASASGKEGFEAELKQLEQLVESLESGDVPLDAPGAQDEACMRPLQSAHNPPEPAAIPIMQPGQARTEAERVISLHPPPQPGQLLPPPLDHVRIHRLGTP